MPPQPRSDLAAVAVVLGNEHAETVAQIAALSADFDGMVAASESSNADDEHDPEGSTIAFERAQVVAVLTMAKRRLAEIDQAVERLSEGTYGVCTRCGVPISAERLVARPSAGTCIACASAIS